MDLLETIPVIITFESKGKNTTKNNGCHVRVRNSKRSKQATYHHCECTQLLRRLPSEYQFQEESFGRFESAGYASESEDDDEDYQSYSQRNKPSSYAVQSYSSNATSSASSSGLSGGDVAAIAVGVGALFSLGAAAVNYFSSFKTLRPSSLKYSQDTIGRNFQNGDFVNNTIFEIAAEKLKASKLERMQVVKKHGYYWSKDNRRLYVFRVLELMGVLSEIEVELLDENAVESKRFTTNCDGCHVAVRGPIYRNCSCSVGRQVNFPDWWNMRTKTIRTELLDTTQRAIYSQQNEEECIVQ